MMTTPIRWENAAQVGSSCIDAGSNLLVPTDAGDLDGDGDTSEPIPFDLDGLPRFMDDPDTPESGVGDATIVDIGAHEFEGFLAIFDADFDADHDVDLEDYRVFFGCLSGPGVAHAPDCEAADFDEDDDVDFGDFELLSRQFTGSL